MTIYRPGRRIITIGSGLQIISPRGGAAAIPWYLSGGVSAANCVAAYQPKGAADYAASKVNLTGNTSYNLVSMTSPTFDPDWNTATGYYYSGLNRGLSTGIAGNPKPVTVIAKVVCSGYAANRTIIGGSVENGVLQFRLTTGQKQQALVQGIVAIGASTSNVGTSAAVVAFTYSAAGAYVFYLNGSSDGSGTNDRSFTKSSALALGHYPNGEYFYGYIHALSLYNSVLTAEQVAAITTAMNAL